MRNKHRIPLFLRRLDLEKLFYSCNIESPANRLELIKSHVYAQDFISYWQDSPDLRFGQLMVNDGFSEFESVYHTEEDEILRLCGLSLPESLIWGSNYFEDGSRRKETLYRFVDELDDKHLATLVDDINGGGKFVYQKIYAQAFSEELLRRGFVNYKITEEAFERLRVREEEFETMRRLQLFNYLSKEIDGL